MTDDEPIDDYSDEWNELDEKVILAQILSELQQIRLTLQNGTAAPESESTMYECKRCGAIVEVDERERHAQGEHNTPADMIGSEFEEV